MNERLQRVAVLGGGSAGWLVAGLLAAEHPDLHITLIESSDVPVIGVGEGTWPSMRDTLRRIGLSETDFIRRCQVSFKQGSRFDGWRNGTASDRYYHPFMLPVGFGDVDLVPAWLATQPERPFADLVSPSVQVCEAGRAPKQVQTPEFGAVANYAYHFDAGLFGEMLREHAVQRLGVHHLVDHVDAVRSHENGDIAALQTREHGELAADLFIDCSGLASRLIGQHFGVPLKSEREVLFNDAALPVQVPHARPGAPLAPCTIATAWSKGWIWDIALPTRRGVGCVFSRQHASEDEAQAALQAYLTATGATGAPSERPSPRLIRYEPGYRAQFWVRNCVAIGLSSGFIEPLEASALALVELSAQRLCNELPMSRASMGAVARRFNDDFAYRWSRVIDFLKLHYLLSERRDSDYWRAHRDPASWPERLRDLLPMWRLRPPARHDFGRIDEVFPAASYQYVLYGMGFRPELPAPSPAKLQAAQACFDEAARQARRFVAALPGHRSLIDHVRDHLHPTAP